MPLPLLQQAWQALLPDGVRGSAGAEAPASVGLSLAEGRSIAGAGGYRVDEFRAGRWQARCALAALGIVDVDLPRRPDGAPAWPPGVVGSLAHTRYQGRPFAVAAVADAAQYRALGVDIEAPQSIPPRAWPTIFTPEEIDALLRLPVPLRSREASLRWSAKEAAVKACGRGAALDDMPVRLDRATGRFVATAGSGLSGCEGRVLATDGGWVLALASIATFFRTAQPRETPGRPERAGGRLRHASRRR